MIRILTSLLTLLLFALHLQAQTADPVIFHRTPPTGEARMCLYDAGSINSFGPLTGQSNDITGDTLFLCMGDIVAIDHADDQDLSSGDPNPATPAGIGYVFYNCTPTVSGETTADIAGDPCILNDNNPPDGFWIYTGGTLGGDVDFFNDGNLQTTFNGGNPDVFFFAPITFDSLSPMGFAAYEGDPIGDCINSRVDQSFAVAYLNEVTISELNMNGCQGSFRVRGGLSELDGSDYPTINIFQQANPGVVATITSGPADHSDVVSFVVPEPGTYVIEVEDEKSCGASTTALAGTCDEVTIFMPLTNVLPSSNECVPVVVEDFGSIVSMQFSINWDPSIISITGVQGFNPAVPDISQNGNFGWENFPVPNAIAPGVMTFSWSDNSFTGVSLPDGSIFFEICFDVVGQLGDCSDLNITSNPVTVEIVNTTEEIILNTRDGKVQVTDDPFFVLVEQDSLTCPGFDDGGFTVTVDQGTAPYQFTWNTIPLSGPNSTPEVIGTNGGSESVMNLAAGMYQVTITDNSVPALEVIDTIEVLAGATLGIMVRDTLPTCFDARDGSLRFIATSDAFPVVDPVNNGYTFNWSTPPTVPNPGNTDYIVDIPAGSYGITVTDPSGCEAIALIPLSQPPPLQVLDANTFIEDASCTGGQDGEIMITASGGTTADGNYTFSWDTGLVITASTTTVTGLNPGTYCVTVTDDNNCMTEECYTVGAVKVLSLTELVTDVNCNGEATGEIFLTGNTAGAPADEPYTFTWSANAPVPTNTTTTSMISNLTAGEYAVTMTDASLAGCQVIDTFTVNQPNPLVGQVLMFNNESCTVGMDGSITLGVSGGTGPYNYVWSHDATLTDSIATNLPAATYTIDITDANMCPTQVVQMISAPTPPQIDQLDDDSVTCPTDTDGMLEVIVTPAPGTTILSYEWTGGLMGSSIDNLAPGEYIVTITADNACVAIDTALVTAPDPIMLDSVTVVQPMCPGQSNGRITVFPSGGTPGYMYIWSDNPGVVVPNNPLTGLAAGDYTVTVVDANMCQSEEFAIAVVDPPTIEAVFSNIMDTSCPDDATCDGQATITATYSDGSPGDFIFTWASGEMTSGGMISTAVQLCEGLQTVNVNDGCGANIEFEIGAPEEISATVTPSQISCNGLADGSVTLTPAGGTSPYNVFWVETGETDFTIDGLSAGQYTAVITDNNSCTFSQFVNITEPDPLVLNIDPVNSTDQVTCAGDMDGVITVIATGGNPDPNTPFLYTWNDGNTGASNTGLGAGTYNVTVTDINNCMDMASFSIAEPDPLVFTLDTIVPPLCFGDPTLISIDTVFGGANNPFEEYTFMVDNNGLNFPVLQPATVFAGTHIVTVEDINGCTEEVSVDIISPGQIFIDFPQSPLVVELGDSTAQLVPTITPNDTYSYQWTPAEFLSADTIRNPFVFPENSLEYTLTIVNANGCTASGDIFVELDANRNVYIPNVFSPNGDGVDDDFRVYTCRGVSNVKSARLFDRWGGLLYEGTNLNPACLNGVPLWDGTQGSDTLPPGVYVYMIEIEFLDGVLLTYRGDVTLLR